MKNDNFDVQRHRFGARTLCVAAASAVFMATGVAEAAHPLVTEDTGTQGQGKYQLELQYERVRDDEFNVRDRSSSFATVLSWGFHDKGDLIVTLPYERLDIDDDGSITEESGRGDVGLDAKWRFYENDNLSFAVKSGLSFATGDEDRDLGAGKINYSVLFITSYEAEPWAMHMHAGYLSNRSSAATDERNHVWHVSVGGWREIGKLKLVADIGHDTSVASGESGSTFAIAGVIYSPSEDIDLDVGVKKGLNDAEVDSALLAGLTLRF